MPAARITVSAVTDEGDNVIVWVDLNTPLTPGNLSDSYSRPREYVRTSSWQIGFSRLARGTEVVISYEPVADEWNIARELPAL